MVNRIGKHKGETRALEYLQMLENITATQVGFILKVGCAGLSPLVHLLRLCCLRFALSVAACSPHVTLFFLDVADGAGLVAGGGVGVFCLIATHGTYRGDAKAVVGWAMSTLARVGT
jgi:hypothetical protein